MAASSEGTSTRRPRPYQSTLRAQAALATRRKILDSAMRLFLDHGYGKVTVGDIAAAASLALPTVYASTGGKAAILGTLIDEAVKDPIVDQTLSAVRKSKSGNEILGIAAHGTRVDNERYHDIIEVLKHAAAVDANAASILQQSNDEYRRALSHVARRLRTLKATPAGMTESRATDVLWFYFGHDAWHLLVADRGWAWDDAEQWLLAQATVALLARR
ncbi:TetR family transcriptional regulator [Mycobacterium kubicae]|uniref:TetR family transcriptional regulator n=1 Tax=Mycobacterium kubicae TaxID=120959 RepID=A0AAX1JFL2_9MYCO|nr:TetR/AcrR family transcriptional regulator [Mycobacterium kubicae]MCV7098578.1 TetR/AcrR family transcriptional regulator [Mycobacterium kubicae]QNI11010.1 TetR/AcrR family transcriptional regulator [Mycobacterium kubicae]QPI39224.1 TetR/AcrR family transcriptional regulator [Mycobacterium kubicae]GFG63763.1 TetR family transcriptional regulator [Mycobacterium kubicae]